MKEFAAKHNFLTRNYLCGYEEIGLSLSENSIRYLKDYSFFRICRISRPQEEIGEVYQEILNSLIACSQPGALISYIIRGDKSGVSVYLACPRESYQKVRTNFAASFTRFDTDNGSSDLHLASNYAGFMIGIPRSLEEEAEQVYAPIIRAMLGKSFYIAITGLCLPIQEVKSALDFLLEELNASSSQITTTSNRKSAGADLSLQQTDYVAQSYVEHLENLKELYETGMSLGMWQTQVLLGAESRSDFYQLSQLVKSRLADSNCSREQLKIIPISNFPETFDDIPYIEMVDSRAQYHPLNSVRNPELYRFLNQTALNSEYLATYFQFPEIENTHFAIDESVAFEVSSRKSGLNQAFYIGEILNEGNQVNNPYYLELDDLTRHGLVIGMTGSGKTNTSKSLLTELWDRHHVPFLVIESAKREYWDMVNISTSKHSLSELTLFTLGEESLQRGMPYRLNPFEVVGDVSIQSHIDRIFATFKASFDLVAPTPFILEQALYEMYEDYGWNIVTNENIFSRKDYPTLTDLVLKIDEIVDASGYQGEIRSNIQASLRARVNSLRVGGKGMMLDVSNSFPIHLILENPTVLELEDLGDDETKSFVIGLLLTQIYEYRQSYNQSKGSQELSHLIVVEEAHRLLKKEEKGESSKAKAIEFFTNLLSEIRSFGQGILIADQIPTKLAPDTLKNTNLKIVHRTVTKEDRDAIGDSMSMTDEQKDYLANLNRGFAAVYAEGDNHPKLVQMPLVHSGTEVSRLDLIRKNGLKYEAYLSKKATVEPRFAIKEWIDALLECDVDKSFKVIDFSVMKREIIESARKKFGSLEASEERNICSYFISSLLISQTLKNELLAKLKKEYRHVT